MEIAQQVRDYAREQAAREAEAGVEIEEETTTVDPDTVVRGQTHGSDPMRDGLER